MLGSFVEMPSLVPLLEVVDCFDVFEVSLTVDVFVSGGSAGARSRASIRANRECFCMYINSFLWRVFKDSCFERGARVAKSLLRFDLAESDVVFPDDAAESFLSPAFFRAAAAGGVFADNFAAAAGETWRTVRGGSPLLPFPSLSNDDLAARLTPAAAGRWLEALLPQELPRHSEAC